ncbi:hypothetical protein NUW54_g8526 [Trametes sanguinea]|uniref:Uncharacterized protein n=1 Tax=Trametes sanguinea TaxID=158606 RepID=A0ACC1PEB9_9APHY|nr:hypothetical protein NUW54_g8526 [Trametes sanguinea]
MIGEHHDIPCLLDKVASVEQLHICGEMLCSEADDEESAHCLELVRIASPIELFLSVVAGDAHLAFLNDLARVASSLCVLELKFSVPVPALQYKDWLDNLPASLRSLDVPCLRVYLPRFLQPYIFGDDAESRASVAGAQAVQMESHRARALRTLPQRLAEAMPSLRLLAIMDGGPNEAILALPVNQYDHSEDTDQQGGEGQGFETDANTVNVDDGSEGEVEESTGPIYEWDELRRTDHFHSHKWWQVTDGMDSRRLKRITVEEGKRAQQQLIDSERQRRSLAARMTSLSI